MIVEPNTNAPEPRRFFRGIFQNRLRQWTAILALGLAASVLSYVVLNAVFLQTAIRETPNRAQFFAKTIDDALQRLSHLPYVVSIEPLALAALADDDAGALNPVLASIAQRADAEFIFVMDVSGRTIASSNYRSSDSLVGEFYTFRPYFQDAMTGQTGRFFAVGATTGRPGYFIADPIRDTAGTIHGAVVVKVSLSEISRTWADSGELIFVTDPQGVVLASSDMSLIFGLTEPLTNSTRQSLEDQRKFGTNELTLLDWEIIDQNRVGLDGTSYLWTTAQVTSEAWTLHLLSDLAGIRTRALLFVALGLATLFALAIVASVFRSTQLKQALAVSNADRTSLAQEIEDRRSAETRLQAAQNALARRNRLAALGQLSASITHELGQPISAMRNYLVAEEIARDAVPGQLAPQLSGLVDRMQGILDQLRSFARQDSDQNSSFAFADAVEGALSLVRFDADRQGVEITSRQDRTAFIRANQPKLEQVIVNLLRNALDAVEGREASCIQIDLSQKDGIATLEVRDNGPGIGDLNIADLQEPFFTTKPSGRGMGLGLAISTQIIDDIGGEFDAMNAGDGGAIFVVRLKITGDSDVT